MTLHVMFSFCPLVVSSLLGPYFTLGTFLLLSILLYSVLHTSYSSTIGVCYNAHYLCSLLDKS
jgi:hypothetical protein